MHIGKINADVGGEHAKAGVDRGLGSHQVLDIDHGQDDIAPGFGFISPSDDVLRPVFALTHAVSIQVQFNVSGAVDNTGDEQLSQERDQP